MEQMLISFTTDSFCFIVNSIQLLRELPRSLFFLSQIEKLNSTAAEGDGNKTVEPLLLLFAVMFEFFHFGRK